MITIILKKGDIMVNKSRKKKISKNIDYQKYFYMSVGSAFALLIVAVILLLLFTGSVNLTGMARATTDTRLSTGVVTNEDILAYMGANNFLAQFKNCFCGETCDDPIREPLDEEETDNRIICIDTDKGANFLTYGETFFMNSDGNIKNKVSDKCISINSGLSGGTVQVSQTFTPGLLEYYCDHLRISSVKTECNCQDGACVEDGSEDIGSLGVGTDIETINADDLPEVDNTVTVDYPLNSNSRG